MCKHTLAAFGAIQLQDDKTKLLRHIRCILTKIHLSSEGVTGALRQMKTLSEK